MSTRIVFMGSPDFALPSLRSLVIGSGSQSDSYKVAGVVTQPDRGSGRGREIKMPPVKLLALELGLPVIQPEKLHQPEAMDQLRAWAPDLIVVAAFGQILKPEVLNVPRFGCINVHASLLPRWRGAAPIIAAILNGDEETGVTIMKLDAGLDTGPILVKRSIRLAPQDTAGSVTATLSTLGADLLVETLPDILAGELSPTPQPLEGVTYAPMLKKEDGNLDFTRPARELERCVRAMNPWPGAWFEYNGQPLKVLKARADVLLTYMVQQPGARLVAGNQPVLATSKDFLFLEEVQPPGKKPMDGKAFLAGARDWK
jgi:methionyl-tRNA formyltransferase